MDTGAINWFDTVWTFANMIIFAAIVYFIVRYFIKKSKSK